MIVCQFCKKEITNKDTAFRKGRWYYCNEECYKKKQDKIKYKPSKTVNNEVNPRRTLTDFILNIYLQQGYDKYEIPWQMIMAQLKNLMIEHKEYNYASVRYTLWYMKEIEQVNLFSEESKGSILTLLPFYYTKAKKYCEENLRLKNKLKNYDFTENVITINSTYQKENVKHKQLDFD